MHDSSTKITVESIQRRQSQSKTIGQIYNVKFHVSVPHRTLSLNRYNVDRETWNLQSPPLIYTYLSSPLLSTVPPSLLLCCPFWPLLLIFSLHSVFFLIFHFSSFIAVIFLEPPKTTASYDPCFFHISGFS